MFIVWYCIYQMESQTVKWHVKDVTTLATKHSGDRFTNGRNPSVIQIFTTRHIVGKNYKSYHNPLTV